MSTLEILAELRRLPPKERLRVMEAALREIERDIAPGSSTDACADRLKAAAQALLPDYAAEGELTAFTALDGEGFHAEG